MSSSLKNIEWDKFEIAVPAFLTIVAMPFTYSIATGIAIGFVFYPITMILKGRIKEVNPIMYLLFCIFLLYFIFLTYISKLIKGLYTILCISFFGSPSMGEL